MNFIEHHKVFIAWYKKKLGLSDYSLLWICFFKGFFLALVLERVLAH